MGFSVSGLSACSRSKRGPDTRAGAKLASNASSRGAEDDAKALCTALHELPSRRRAECCSEPPVSLYFDQCVRLLSNAVRARTVSVDASKVALCAARVAETTRGCDWVAPTLAVAPAECDGALSGLVGEGGRCTSSLECRGALHCAGQGATTPGVCRAPQAAGAACGSSVDSLATYLGVRALEERKPLCDEFCDLTAHRCEAKPAPGAPCNASVNCAPDQACKNGRCETIALAARKERALPGKKCSNDVASLTGGPALVLGRNPGRGSSVRTSTGNESTSR
jgi:hypothetical protein